MPKKITVNVSDEFYDMIVKAVDLNPVHKTTASWLREAVAQKIEKQKR